MNTLLQVQTASPRQAWWADRRIIWALWLLAGVLLISLIGYIPLERKQEARVLQVAREMLEDWHKWLIPHINGQVRLRKPPLAYWLAALSFKTFGVSVWAGRLPMALLGWLTIGLTYQICRSILNARAALFAAGCLTGCYLFYRYGQAAETDVVTTFFLTAGVYAIWQGLQAQRRWHSCAWYHASAIAIGLAALGKGPPAGLALLLFIAWACAERYWKALGDYLKSGALITLAIVAVPWFVYVMRAGGSAVMQEEVTVLVAGADHPAPFWQYFPFLIKMTLPWTGLFILSIVAAIPHYNRNRQVRTLLIWATVFFVPFMLIRQKQEHYLLPLMPAIMAIIGWMLDRALTGDDPPLTRAVKWVVLLTAIAGLVASALPIVVGHVVRGWLTGFDIALSIALLLLMALVLLMHYRKGLAAAVYTLLLSGTLATTLLLGLWTHTLEPINTHDVARDLRQRFGAGPYAFLGEESATLSFLLNQTVPTYSTPQALAAALAQNPHLVLIEEKQKGRPTPPLSLPQQMTWTIGEDQITAYRATPN